MAAPFELPDRCDIWRPVNVGVPIELVAEDVPCRIWPNLVRGIASQNQFTTAVTWSHCVDFEDDVDVRDNSNGLIFLVGGTFFRYELGSDLITATLNDVIWQWAVVWCEFRFTNTERSYKRTYVMRYQNPWGNAPPYPPGT